MAIYLVNRADAKEGDLPRLIEARTSVAAVAYAARTDYEAVALSTKEAFKWGAKGVELEEATTAEEEAKARAEEKVAAEKKE